MLPISLWQLLVLLPIGAPCPTLDQKCSTADTALAEGDVMVSNVAGGTEKDELWMKGYVRPATNFDGVSVWVQGNQRKFGVWFPLPRECFKETAWWWVVQVAVWLKKNSFPFNFHIMARVKECALGCLMTTTERGIVNLGVAAHGASSWRNTPPDASCSTVELPGKWNFSLGTCKTPPNPESPKFCPKTLSRPKASATSPPASTAAQKMLPVWVVAVIVVVAVLVIVVLAVVVAVKVRKLQVPETSGISISPPVRPRAATPAQHRVPVPNTTQGAVPGWSGTTTPVLTRAITPGLTHATTPGLTRATAPGLPRATTPGLGRAAAPGLPRAVAPGWPRAAAPGWHKQGQQEAGPQEYHVYDTISGHYVEII